MIQGELTQRRVLLVEDDRDDYLLTKELLAEIGGTRICLDWVPEYDDGIRAIRDRPYDICLLDYQLGAHDGLDFIEHAVNVGSVVPIVFLTGTRYGGVEQRALAAGASDYLVKGEIDAAILERSIRHSIERGRNLSALRARERQFRAVFDCALDAMLITNDQARYTDANPAALSLLGLSREQLLGRRVHEVVALDPAAAEAAWTQFLAAGHGEGEFLVRRADGELRTVEFRATANMMPGSHLSVLRDVTERRRAEENRLRLAAIVESADDAIHGLTLDGVINYWSPSAERMYGYSAAEVLGRSKTLLLPQDRREELDELLRKLGRGETVRHWETIRRRKDGSTFEASVTMSPIRTDGSVVGASVVMRDISERKRLEARLSVSDRMASMGILAAGVAHEINNPLAAVIANLEFIGSAGASDPEFRPAIDDARSSAQRMREIMRDLKVFSRPDELHRGPVDLRRVLESSIRLAWNEIRHRARVVEDFAETPLIDGNEARLGQVFLNLLTNAAHAIGEGDAERHEIRITLRTDDAGRALVVVRDTGCGIPPEQLGRVFEPFYTTKPVGIGTGLGLSICQRIVQELSGEIWAESKPGEGTSFCVLLPAAPAVSGFPPAPVAARVAAAPARLLVVDDELIVARAIERTLTNTHHVVVLTSAEAALEQIRSGVRYDLILSDLMMPQMTGMDLHEAIARIDALQAERIVFLTGGAFTPRARRFLDRVKNERLEKPFDAQRLRALVDERLALLDAQKSGATSPPSERRLVEAAPVESATAGFAGVAQDLKDLLSTIRTHAQLAAQAATPEQRADELKIVADSAERGVAGTESLLALTFRRRTSADSAPHHERSSPIHESARGQEQCGPQVS